MSEARRGLPSLPEGLTALGVAPRYGPPPSRERGAEEGAGSFGDVFEGVPMGLVVWRLEDVADPGSFRLVGANPAARRVVSGFEEVLGKRVSESFPGLLRTELPGACAEVVREGRRRDLGDVRYGDERVPEGIYAVKAFPLLDRCVGLTFEDVTERRRAEEQLQQGQRLEILGRLAAGIAHDFNNVMTGVMGYSELILDRQPPEPWNGYAREIFDAAQKAAGLNRQLMAFSRRQVLEPRVLDLRVSVAGVLKLLRRLIGEDVTLVTSCPPELGRVKADPAQVEQVLMNLALNARDAMPRGGTLTFRLADVHRSDAEVRGHGRPGGQHVLLEVSDTGFGMDRETLSHVFEPFYTTKGPGRGTGLGLATVYGIVRQSGGHLEVDSAPGLGSTFRVFFPTVGEPLDLALDEPATELARGWETVLVVEDEEPVRRLLRQGLEDCGYTVLEAAGAVDALSLSGDYARPIHLLVTDVVMPRMTGPELWVSLSARRRGLRVLFVSGYPDDTTLELLAGGVAVLAKPFTRAGLARKVREVLDTEKR